MKNVKNVVSDILKSKLEIETIERVNYSINDNGYIVNFKDGWRIFVFTNNVEVDFCDVLIRDGENENGLTKYVLPQHILADREIINDILIKNDYFEKTFLG